MPAKKKTATAKPARKARWPYVPCPEGGFTTAADLLNCIAFDAATYGAPNFDLILKLVMQLAANGYTSNATEEERCDGILAASRHADAQRWFRVADTLESLMRRTRNAAPPP